MPKGKVRWETGGVLDNFHAAANALGYEHLPLAWGLAKVNWPSIEDRDAALRALVGMNEGAPGAAPTA